MDVTVDRTLIANAHSCCLRKSVYHEEHHVRTTDTFVQAIVVCLSIFSLINQNQIADKPQKKILCTLVLVLRSVYCAQNSFT
jgi:hypothetical protein